MGAAAKYTLDIKDIADVGPVVDMTVKLDKYIAYSYQSPTSVQNELLSEVTTPGYFAATVLTSTVSSGATLYIPFYSDCFLKSATCSSGFQYATAYLTTNLLNKHATKPATLVATCQFSYNGNDWYDASYQSICHVTDRYGITEFTLGDFFNQLFATFIIPGSINPVALWVRWLIYNQAGGGDVDLVDYTVSMDVIPRHTHVWQQVGQSPSTMQSDQVDNAIQSAAATPELITCIINGGAPFNITCAAPTYSNNVNIKASLVTGVNTIEFSSTEPCTVTPSANYLAFSA